jgi:phosphate transport system substrate-binding protein
MKTGTACGRLNLVFAAALGMALLWCPPPGSAQGSAAKSAATGKLVITGSSTMAPLVSEIAQRFTKLHAGIAVEVHSGGSGRGISDLRAGASSIAMASRPLLDTERDLFAVPIARDGVALIVHGNNPLKNVTAKQTIDILTGKITSWKALGGKDAAVALIWSGSGQGSSETLLEQLNLTHADIRAARATIVGNAQRIHEVESDENALAPNSIGESERRAQAGARIRLLDFDGIAASSRTIMNGSYALSRPLALVTRRLPTGAEKRFIDFALSGHVADLFPKYDFVAYQE